MELTTILSILLLSSTLVHASLNLSNIQELVGFPEACTTAYNTPIPDCNSAHFLTGPLCSCTSACESALEALTTTINAACQGTAASPDTLIGLFFENQATNFLCTPPDDPAGDSGCSTVAGGSGSMSSASGSTQVSTSSSSSTIATTTTSNSQTTSSVTTKQASSSTLSMQSTASTTPMTSSKTSASSSKSTAISKMSSTKSTSSMSSSTRTVTSSQPKQTSGGGSPFDISSNTGTRISIRTHEPALLFLFLTILAMGFS